MLQRTTATRETPQLSLLGGERDRDDNFVVRESARARRLTVRVFPGGRVEVVVPRGTPPAMVQHFVARHRQWIDLKVREFGCRDTALCEALPHHVGFQSVGEQWQVVYERVAHPLSPDGAEAVLEGSIVVAQGVAPP